MFLTRERRIVFIAFLVCLSFFVVKFLTISDYGTNWDESGRDNRGQAYLHYFLTGSKDYHDLAVPRRSIYQDDSYSYPVINKWIGHPPLGDILSSFSNYIFYQNLGIMGDIESYHLFYIVACSLFVGSILYFTAMEYGIFAGIIATLALVLYPLFLGESSFNFKDPVQMSFYAMTIIAFYKAILTKKYRWVIASSIFAGLALGIKFNILFAIFIVFPWLIIYQWQNIKKIKWPISWKFTLSIFLIPLVAFIMLFACWPYLWSSPIANLINVFKYYKDIGYGITYQPNSYISLLGFNTYAIQWIFYTTPIIILVLSFAGIVYAIKKGINERNKMSILILFWFFVPIIKVTIPGAGIYGGVRQIMEYIPAMAILSGIGAAYMIKLLHNYVIKHKLSKQLTSRLFFLLQLLVILSFLPIILKLISIHPNENVYFNFLIGGLKGAEEHQLPGWGNSFGNAYRQGANWLNKNAEKGAKAYLAVSYEANLPNIWLRKDIQYSHKLRHDYLSQKGEYILEMTGDETNLHTYCTWIYVQNFLIPVYEVKVDNVSIFAVWKNDRAHTKLEFLNVDKQNVFNKCIKDDEL